MLSIKEVEQLTGISKQNIRYYEKQGLIHPKRNPDNDYREYTEEELERLKEIKLFRKLDMPIEEIRRVLSYEIDLQDALQAHKERLGKEKERLTAAMEFCGKIEEQDLKLFPVDSYLEQMEQEEKAGSVFANWMSDFMRVEQCEQIREFSFKPDSMCMTPAEFTEALFQYANENHLNLVITKEGMYPEFTIDGIEYEAERFFGRFGATVNCRMKHPEEIVPDDIPKETYRKMRRIHKIYPFVISAILFVLLYFEELRKNPLLIVVLIVTILVLLLIYIQRYNNLK